ncbi:MAG: YhcH/YjgK/YiaL family protein [Prevotella sp.]|nr:YhcH/YjgK/YiaL family protein [Prevotella sp.]MBR4650611.1 YhcH/YjgK/YiaL family protein [Prevotella sp.]
MIVDTLDNLKYYVGVNPLFADVVKFLEDNDLEALEPGKHEIKGKELFVNIINQKGKMPDEAVMETHKNMLDIQLPITGEETYGYLPLEDITVEAEYNAEKDVTKYPEQPASTYVTCRPGMMAIFFPQDGHTPCISTFETFKKAVFKVKC